jgi:hypothetical protein
MVESVLLFMALLKFSIYIACAKSTQRWFASPRLKNEQGNLSRIGQLQSISI